MKNLHAIACILFIVATGIGAYTTYTIHIAGADPYTFPESTLNLIWGMYVGSAACFVVGIIWDVIINGFKKRGVSDGKH